MNRESWLNVKPFEPGRPELVVRLSIQLVLPETGSKVELRYLGPASSQENTLTLVERTAEIKGGVSLCRWMANS